MTDQKNATRPTYFGIEVTRKCNLRCPHCFTKSSVKEHPGPDGDAFRSLLRRLVAAGAKRIAFSGGEPLLRKDLEEHMRYGLKIGVEGYSLVTNGSLIDRARAKSLKKVGLDSAQISVDGVDATDHCEIRHCSPKAYYRAIRGIRLLREAGIVVDVATILVHPNIERAPEMVLFCEALGVRSLRYCSFVPTGRAVDEAIKQRFSVDPDQLDSFFQFMRMMRAQKKLFVHMIIDHGVGPWNKDGEFACTSGSEVAYISAEGDLYPCPGLIQDRFKVGNVHEEDLEEILNRPSLHEVRELCRQDVAEPCKSCDNELCSGGCRGAAYACTGDVLGPPEYCNVLRRGGTVTAS